MALAAPTLTATPDPASGAVRLVVGSIPAGATTVTVTRTHPSGRVWTVRQWNAAPVSGTTMQGDDYEAPLGVAVTYAATVSSATETSPASTKRTVTLEDHDTATSWLKDPRVPALNMRVMVDELDQQTFQGRIGVMDVIGRPAPVTIGDVREAATGSMTLVALDQDDVLGIHYLTASGNPLLFQTSPLYGIGSLYMAVTRVVERRVTRLGMFAERRFVLDWTEVDPPAGTAGAGFVTYAIARNGYATYTALRTGESDYLDLAQHVNTVAPGSTKPLDELLTWRGG